MISRYFLSNNFSRSWQKLSRYICELLGSGQLAFKLGWQVSLKLILRYPNRVRFTLQRKLYLHVILFRTKNDAD